MTTPQDRDADSPQDSPGVFRTWGGCWAAVGCSIIMWVGVIWVAREILDWMLS